MKKPPHPPSKPLTAKRQKILNLAMAQLKKTRAQMDPKVLDKIRHVIASNPKVMKGLGLDKMPEDSKPERVMHKSKPQAQAQAQAENSACKVAEIERKLKEIKASKATRENKPKIEPVVKPTSKGEEKIDKGHNMEVLAKLMQLKPSEIENIKSVILKNKG